ncbi:MAG: hypothetical protein HZA27_05050, partial [Candidatus Omnitrophica bacterium]|nr:hypothetical protein [Candidatus Omnitrophota bacterium]
MNRKKLKLLMQLYWVRILVTIIITAIAISFIFFLRASIIAWMTLESYFKKSALAQYALFFYTILIMNLISLPLSGILWIWIMRGGHMKMAQLHKKAVSGKEIQVSWDDVIGMEEGKQEAMEVVSLVMDRAQLQRIGGKILRGILMIGPPGCGKTYLA